MKLAKNLAASLFLVLSASSFAETDRYCRENDNAWDEVERIVRTMEWKFLQTADGKRALLTFERILAGAGEPAVQCRNKPGMEIADSLAEGAVSIGPGRVVISIETIQETTNDDELAFVISHETAHGHLGHWKANMEARDTEKDAATKGLMMREFELAADEEALKTMKKAGFDPAGALSYAKRKAASEPEQQEGAAHPAWKTRLFKLTENPLTVSPEPSNGQSQTPPSRQ